MVNNKYIGIVDEPNPKGSEDTLDIFCTQLLDIAEQTAAADLEGLEAEEDSIINLLKKKFS